MMAGEKIELFIQKVHRRERNDFLRYHLLWGIVWSLLALFPCLFLARFLEFTLPIWVFALFSLPAIGYLFLRTLGRFPGEEEATLKADRVLGWQEQLVTARESLAVPMPDLLTQLLVQSTESRLIELPPFRWPRRSLRWPGIILLVVVLAGIALIWLPPYRVLQAGQLTPLLEELIQRYSRLPGNDPLTYMELIQTQRALERGDLEEAQGLLEQADARLGAQARQDQAGNDALAADPDLTFLTKGMAGDASSLNQLEQLSPQEQVRLAQEIQRMLEGIPEGSLHSALQSLATSLRQNDTALRKKLEDLSGLLPEERALLASVSQALAQLGAKGDSSSSGIPSNQGLQPETQVQAASGVGTQGGISQEKLQPGSSSEQYIKAPAETLPAAGDSDLLYIPQDLPTPNTNGSPLILPQDSQSQSGYQAGQESDQSSESQPFQDYRAVLPRYQQQAVQQLTRQALPPDLQTLVQRYYQSLETTP